MNCIKRKFTIRDTTQKNGVAERESKSLYQLPREMVTEKKAQQRFWAEVIHTTIVILKKYIFQPTNEKTLYELWIGIP